MTPEQKELLENWNHNPCRGDYCKDVNALLAAQRAKDAEIALNAEDNNEVEDDEFVGKAIAQLILNQNES